MSSPPCWSRCCCGTPSIFSGEGRSARVKLPFLGAWRESRLQGYSDAVLCEECLAGNEEAWGALLTRHQNLIYSIPLKFHFNSDQAADIFQAVAVDLYT